MSPKTEVVQREEATMALTMKERKAVTKEVAERYRRATKSKKGAILSEFVKLTGYNRSYAAYLLRNWGRKVKLKVQDRQLVVVLGETRKKKRRKRKKVYGKDVFVVLRKIWAICDGICSKRLHPFLPEITSVLEKLGEIKIDKETKRKLLRVSPATIDRLLAKEKKELELKARSRTKPGTLLKHQIPVRTFSDWDEKRPGFLELDLVSHDGGNSKGDFLQTLDATDISTTWTETQAARNKAQKWVFRAFEDIKARIPFEVLGIDSDNGSEFINDHLLRFCQESKITFTRTRPYRKNDNCFVEQKNYSVVRKAVGYLRYDTEEELKTLNELYEHLRLYTNFFQPTMKLVEKKRVGSKVKKKYDQAKTPYQRVLESLYVSQESKEKLKQEYAKLNPVELKRKITKLQNKLIKLATLKKELRREQQKENKDFEYIFDEATNHAFV